MNVFESFPRVFSRMQVLVLPNVANPLHRFQFGQLLRVAVSRALLSIRVSFTEMNGLLDSDFADEAVMFDSIGPIISNPLPGEHLSEISPSVPFPAMEPTINVGYTDPGNFAPLANIVHHPEVVSVAPCSSTTNRNNNCHVTSSASIVGVDSALIDASRHGFRPLDPADVTSPLPGDDVNSAAARRTTPLPAGTFRWYIFFTVFAVTVCVVWVHCTWLPILLNFVLAAAF